MGDLPERQNLPKAKREDGRGLNNTFRFAHRARLVQLDMRQRRKYLLVGERLVLSQELGGRLLLAMISA